MCLYSLSYVYLYHIFCTRPAGLLVCLFVYQNVQGANGKHITIKKDTWKPMVSTQVQEVAHFVLRLPKFCHQLLLLSKSNLILPSSNMGGCALKVFNLKLAHKSEFCDSFRYYLNWSHGHFYWCFICYIFYVTYTNY